MIRLIQRAAPALLSALLVFALAVSGAAAKEKSKGKSTASPTSESDSAKPGKSDKKSAKADKNEKKSAKDDKGKKSGAKAGSAKSTPVGRFGEWDVFATSGKGKTCYTLARPKERVPANLKRDDAYVFISNRPAENVHNEISVIMGFAMKDGAEPSADIGGAAFQMIAKGSNAWLKNPAEEGRFIEAMKKGSKLVVKASSSRGHASTDTYSLAGISEALARIRKDCP